METIYIKLIDEEVKVWRPVYATYNEALKGYFIEPPPTNIVPEDEIWEFKPGMTVKTKKKLSDNEEILIAISQI